MSLLVGCAGRQSILEPAGPSAQAIAGVWWWMLGGAALVYIGVVAVWLQAMRPDRAGMDGFIGGADEGAAAPAGQRWIIGGGIVLPAVAITLLLVFGSSAGLHQLPLPLHGAGGAAPMRIDAIGRQWLWTLHYPGSGVTLRNEMRLPVGRTVDIHVSSLDVIHSFWVPRLGGKLDAIPGRTGIVRLRADQPGTFRGQCAEFCGLGHAHMVMTVHAMPQAEFDAWLATQASSMAPDAGSTAAGSPAPGRQP